MPAVSLEIAAHRRQLTDGNLKRARGASPSLDLTIATSNQHLCFTLDGHRLNGGCL